MWALFFVRFSLRFTTLLSQTQCDIPWGADFKRCPVARHFVTVNRVCGRVDGQAVGNKGANCRGDKGLWWLMYCARDDRRWRAQRVRNNSIPSSFREHAMIYAPRQVADICSSRRACEVLVSVGHARRMTVMRARRSVCACAHHCQH